jgi:hypothetical protein
MNISRLCLVPFAIAMISAAVTITTQAQVAIRENGERVDILYEGLHTIQGTASLDGPWTNLFTGSGPFTDPASATLRARFYRLRDEPGPTYSSNIVGYYRVDLGSCGYTLIANQLIAPGGNKISNLFRAPAEGTEIYKFNRSLGGYDLLSFVGGAWEAGDPDMTLEPGEGAFLHSPAGTHRFLGEVPLTASVIIHPGYQIISSPATRAGYLEGPPPMGLGFSPADGDTVYPFFCWCGYCIDQYIDPASGGTGWEGGSAGAPPYVSLGQSFWLSTYAASPRIWHAVYRPDP